MARLTNYPDFSRLADQEVARQLKLVWDGLLGLSKDLSALVIPDTTSLQSDVLALQKKRHNDVQALQGGSATERFHLTAAQFALLTGLEFFQGNNSAVQSFTTGVRDPLTIDTERYSTNPALHSTTVNNSRISVPAGKAGVWHFGACLQFAANATGRREMEFKVNDTTFRGSVVVASNTAAAVTVMSLGVDISLAEGDYVELTAIQTSGGPLNGSLAADFLGVWCFGPLGVV